MNSIALSILLLNSLLPALVLGAPDKQNFLPIEQYEEAFKELDEFLATATDSEDPFESYKAVHFLLKSAKPDENSPLLAAARILDSLKRWETCYNRQDHMVKVFQIAETIDLENPKTRAERAIAKYYPGTYRFCKERAGEAAWVKISNSGEYAEINMRKKTKELFGR